MTSIAEALAQREPRGKAGVPCGVARAYALIKPRSEVEAMRAAMSEPGARTRHKYSARVLHEVFAENGHDVSVWSIDRHRRRDCGCDAL